MALPPVLAGAVKPIVASASPAVAAPMTGTPGTLAPTVNQPIAMAYLAANHAQPQHEVYAEVRGKRQPMADATAWATCSTRPSPCIAAPICKAMGKPWVDTPMGQVKAG